MICVNYLKSPSFQNIWFAMRIFSVIISQGLVTYFLKEANVVYKRFQALEKLYSPHDGQRHLSTIPIKDSHLFKIGKSVISFCLKKNSNSAILNKWESFNGIVDHVTYPP